MSEALSVLDTSSRSRAIVDRTVILETRGVFFRFFKKEPIIESFLPARILSKQKSPEAEEAWQALIEHNSDSYEYYRGYLKYLGIDDGAPTLTYLTCTTS